MPPETNQIQVESDAITERRYQVYRYKLAGASIREIANTLKVNPSTVQRDLRAVELGNVQGITEFKQEMAQEHAKTMEQIVGRRLLEIEHGRLRAYKLVNAADRDSTSLMALATLAELDEQERDLLQDIGVLTPQETVQRRIILEVHQKSTPAEAPKP